MTATGSMSGPEHYREAGRLMAMATETRVRNDHYYRYSEPARTPEERDALLVQSQVHATLANAAAVAFAALTNHGAIMQTSGRDALEPWNGDDEIAAVAADWHATMEGGAGS